MQNQRLNAVEKIVLIKSYHETKHLVEFNDKINADDRIQKVLLPIRDGLYLNEKIK